MTYQTTDREILYFDEIKEDRGSYFVEYQPPISKAPFATMNIVYPDDYVLESVAETMKKEVAHWLGRYAVPIMAWAYDASENQICPNGNIDDGVLTAWLSPGSKIIMHTWKTKESPAFLNDTENRPDWRTIYKDLPFRTDAEVKSDAQQKLLKTREQNYTLKIVLAIWLAVIPATWAVIQYLGPDWLATGVLLYSLWQAFRAARKLFWNVQPTAAEKAKSEKESKMAHYYYHCERNPEGFSRLKVENFERVAKERIAKEAAELKNKNKAMDYK